jgi:hypothetical protein
MPGVGVGVEGDLGQSPFIVTLTVPVIAPLNVMLPEAVYVSVLLSTGPVKLPLNAPPLLVVPLTVQLTLPPPWVPLTLPLNVTAVVPPRVPLTVPLIAPAVLIEPLTVPVAGPLLVLPMRVPLIVPVVPVDGDVGEELDPPQPDRSAPSPSAANNRHVIALSCEGSPSAQLWSASLYESIRKARGSPPPRRQSAGERPERTVPPCARYRRKSDGSGAQNGVIWRRRSSAAGTCAAQERVRVGTHF